MSQFQNIFKRNSEGLQSEKNYRYQYVQEAPMLSYTLRGLTCFTNQKPKAETSASVSAAANCLNLQVWSESKFNARSAELPQKTSHRASSSWSGSSLGVCRLALEHSGKVVVFSWFLYLTDSLMFLNGAHGVVCVSEQRCCPNRLCLCHIGLEILAAVYVNGFFTS